MAYGIETPADIANVPEANTAIPVVDNRLMDNYWRGAEMQFRQKQQAYQQDKDALDNRIKALDFSTAGTWDRDLPFVNEKFSDVSNYAEQNPNALNPTVKDVGIAGEFNRKKNDVAYWATKSKADKATYDAQKNLIATKPDLKKHAHEYMTQLDTWANTPIDQRGDFALQIQSDWNILADQDKKTKLLQYDNPNLKGVPDSNGNIIYSSASAPKTDALVNYLKSRYQTNDEEAQAAEQIFNTLTPQEQAQYKQDGSDGIKNYYVDQELLGIPMEDKTKQLVRSNWFAQFATKQQAAKPDFTELTNNLNALETLPSIPKTGVINPAPAQMSTGFNGTPIILPGGQQDVITGVFKIGGTLYARPSTLQESDGSIKFEDLQPITNKRNQLAVPYIKDNVTKGQYLGSMQELLNAYDETSKGIETNPKEAKTAKSGTIKVSLNGQLGEIPSDQWEAFKKKYPSAVKQ